MCPTCDRLRAENRELREELAEYQNRVDETLDGEVAIISHAMNLPPQAARFVAILAKSAGRVVTSDVLIDSLEYGGTGEFTDKGETRDIKQVHVLMSRVRSGLARVGITNATKSVYGVGQIMTEDAARRVRALVSS